MTDVEAQCRGFLENAAARQAVVARPPDDITPDYQAGFGAGWEAGQVAGLALAVSIMSGEPLSAVLDDATSRASTAAMFPLEMRMGEAS